MVVGPTVRDGCVFGEGSKVPITTVRGRALLHREGEQTKLAVAVALRPADSLEPRRIVFRRSAHAVVLAALGPTLAGSAPATSRRLRTTRSDAVQQGGGAWGQARIAGLRACVPRFLPAPIEHCLCPRKRARESRPARVQEPLPHPSVVAQRRWRPRDRHRRRQQRQPRCLACAFWAACARPVDFWSRKWSREVACLDAGSRAPSNSTASHLHRTCRLPLSSSRMQSLALPLILFFKKTKQNTLNFMQNTALSWYCIAQRWDAHRCAHCVVPVSYHPLCARSLRERVVLSYWDPWDPLDCSRAGAVALSASDSALIQR